MLVVAAAAASVWLRCKSYRQESLAIKKSPVSLAVQDALAGAGGVYLSLLAIFSFLKCSVPESVKLAGMEGDPLAFISLIVTIMQPFAKKIICGGRRNANK
jgi:hypothetical protein